MSHVEVVHRDGRAVVSIRGDLDLASTGAFEEAAALAESVYGPRLYVDLSDLAFIDSSGLGALTRLHRRLAGCDGGGLTVIVVPGGRIERIFRCIGLDRAMDVHRPRR
ncbi:STAS domain-containing protein [Nocardiopsis sediminis]|uniref:STAS domain-containing protein n=1 Tax=Nocardiopsis sediminis TaxID=1778267 RepID=A0ABV8FL98_9ACTN